MTLCVSLNTIDKLLLIFRWRRCEDRYCVKKAWIMDFWLIKLESVMLEMMRISICYKSIEITLSINDFCFIVPIKSAHIQCIL